MLVSSPGTGLVSHHCTGEVYFDADPGDGDGIIDSNCDCFVLGEDFETTATGSIPAAWTLVSAGILSEVVDTEAHSSAKSLRLVGSGSTDASIASVVPAFSGRLRVTHYVKADSAGWTGTDGEVTVTLDHDGRRAVAGILKRGNEFFYIDHATRETSTVPARVDDWVKVVTELDFFTDQSKVFFEGSPIPTFASPLETGDSSTTVTITSGNGTTDLISAFYDDIGILSNIPP
jgi:hypothetical protein